MRIKSLAIALALVLVIGLVGCESNLGGANGKLIVRISADAKAKGISPIGMDVDHYSINLTSEGRDPITQDDVASGYVTFEVPPATWDVVVKAHNKDGIAIGEGCGSCVVTSGATSECAILVEEYTGKGNLNLVAEVSGEGVAKVEILDARDNVVASGNLASGSNIFQLDSGFYLLKIADGSGETLYVEAFKIVASHDTNATVHISTNGEVAIRITNGIQNIPDLALSMKTVFSFGEEFTVEAQVENLPDPVYKWYLDDALVEGADSSVYAGAIPAKDGIAEGTHTITCVVSSGDVVWSVKKQFSVLEKTFEGAWWVAPKPDESRKVYLKLDMHGGHIVYDYYDGDDNQALLGQESEYQIQKSGEDYEISFYNGWYGWRFRFVVHGGDLGNVEFDSPRWGMTDVTFEPFVSGPEWTDRYAEYDDEWHVRTISNPELGTFEVTGTDRTRHQFDGNGICVRCGYDSTKHLYEVNSDLSVVDESVDNLEVRRYWPSLLTLWDGTVVDDSNGFYIKKKSSSLRWGNYYILYIPHTIADFYVKNGGGVSHYAYLEDGVMRWYVEQALGRDFHEHPCNEMLQELFANGNQIERLDPGTIEKPDKVKVSNDVSKLDSFDDKDRWWDWKRFTLNDVEFEDGSPVTDAEAFYFSVDRYNRVRLYMPDCIIQEFEKGGDSNDSWQCMRWYHDTYYPELRYYMREIGFLKVLLSEEFKEPSYLDVGDRYKD